MNKKVNIACAIAAIVFAVSAVKAETHSHGSFKADGSALVWNNDNKSWITPDKFWQNFTANRGGLTWQQSRHYPAYNQVKEHDTFLVEIDSGVCLMEFFHSRWRRANDVQRWDDKFNRYSGCDKVFE